MAITVLGTPANIDSGGTYAPESGTSARVLVVASLAKNSPVSTLTNLLFNSVTRTPSVTSADPNVDSAALSVFKNSELASSTLTPTWDVAPAGRRHVMITADGVDQSSTVRGTKPTTTGNGDTVVLSFTGLAVGDLCVAAFAHRDDLGAITVPSGWTEAYDAAGAEGGRFYCAYKIAASTSETFTCLTPATNDYAGVGVAFIPNGAAARSSTLTLLGVG